MKNTVVFDFDGVIHSYTSGWKGEDVIPDPPVEGIEKVISNLRDCGYEIIIVSTRSATQKGIQAMIDWLKKYNIDYDNISDVKPPALVYIDDRAICFDGDTTKLVSKIKNFVPWTEEKKIVDACNKHPTVYCC